MCKRTKSIYTMSELNLFMMKMFNSFNAEYFGAELPKVIITFESGFKKGAFGWITTTKNWKQGNEVRYNINISSDYLDRPIPEIMSTLLHEMCHLYALEKQIKDTSRSGIYHNKQFKKIAEEHGLLVEEADKIGWSVTSLKPETAAFVETQTEKCGGIRLMKCRPKEKAEKCKPKQSSRKYVCPSCGLLVRATKEVKLICGECFDPESDPIFLEIEE